MITLYPDPILRKPSSPVEPGGVAMTMALTAMRQAYEALKGNIKGLAAPQVGWPVRIILVTEKNGPRILLNPEIVERSPERITSEEGCLSLPGVKARIDRHAIIVLTARDETGNNLRLMAGGIQAIAVQHEIDHLDGILIIDRLTKKKRREALRNLRPQTALIQLPGLTERGIQTMILLPGDSRVE